MYARMTPPAPCDHSAPIAIDPKTTGGWLPRRDLWCERCGALGSLESGTWHLPTIERDWRNTLYELEHQEDWRSRAVDSVSGGILSACILAAPKGPDTLQRDDEIIGRAIVLAKAWIARNEPREMSKSLAFALELSDRAAAVAAAVELATTRTEAISTKDVLDLVTRLRDAVSIIRDLVGTQSCLRERKR